MNSTSQPQLGKELIRTDTLSFGQSRNSTNSVFQFNERMRPYNGSGNRGQAFGRWGAAPGKQFTEVLLPTKLHLIFRSRHRARFGENGLDGLHLVSRKGASDSEGRLEVIREGTARSLFTSLETWRWTLDKMHNDCWAKLAENPKNQSVGHDSRASKPSQHGEAGARLERNMDQALPSAERNTHERPI